MLQSGYSGIVSTSQLKALSPLHNLVCTPLLLQFEKHNMLQSEGF
jgi:hypothetical protein